MIPPFKNCFFLKMLEGEIKLNSYIQKEHENYAIKIIYIFNN